AFHHMTFATRCLDHGLVTAGHYSNARSQLRELGVSSAEAPPRCDGSHGNQRSSRPQFGLLLLEFVSWRSPLTVCAVYGALKRCAPWSARPGLRPNLWCIHCSFAPEPGSGKKCARCPESSTFRSTRQWRKCARHARWEYCRLFCSGGRRKRRNWPLAPARKMGSCSGRRVSARVSCEPWL